MSNNEKLLFKTTQQDLSMEESKISSQGSLELYPASSVMFRVNTSKARIK